MKQNGWLSLGHDDSVHPNCETVLFYYQECRRWMFSITISVLRGKRKGGKFVIIPKFRIYINESGSIPGETFLLYYTNVNASKCLASAVLA